MAPTPEIPPASGAEALPPPAGVEAVPAWLTLALQWAAARGATDIHLFPAEDDARFWVRLDGELVEAARYSMSIHSRLVARLKVLARCTDYAGELVQEGRFSLGEAGSGEARLSILSTLRGEKAVVRILPGGDRLRQLGELGFEGNLANAMRSTLDQPQGLLLAVGPSGSGKSTALYALLGDLHARAGRPLAIVTIEDPVEQSLSFASQVGVDPARGLGFGEGLRAILRQDPEVIMIGEVRDAETAMVALQAALTGHRLLSSMHTTSAGEALVRLRQMGAPAYVISSALAGILNLRLARLLCPHCRGRRPLSPEEQARFPEAAQWPEPAVGLAVGCPACLGGGRQGRTGLGEWIIPTPATSNALQGAEAAPAIAATLQVCVPARPAALALLRAGKMGLEEWPRLAGLVSL